MILRDYAHSQIGRYGTPEAVIAELRRLVDGWHPADGYGR
jgi:hypothetical protein